MKPAQTDPKTSEPRKPFWLITAVGLILCLLNVGPLEGFAPDSHSIGVRFPGGGSGGWDMGPIARGVPRPSARGEADSGGSVLCCWYCNRDRRQKCERVSESFCNKWGAEVSSCSECLGGRQEDVSPQEISESRSKPKIQNAPEERKRKLAKPRVPYLSELIMDIDGNLVDLVQQGSSSAVTKMEKLYRAAKASNVPLKEREASTQLAHVYYLTGQVEKSGEYYSKSLLISRRIKDAAGEAEDQRNLAAACTAAGDFASAERHNLEALQQFRAAGAKTAERMTANNLGVLEKNRGRYSQALNWYETALEKENETQKLRAVTLRNLGYFFAQWGQYRRAIGNYHESAALSEQLHDYKQAAESLLDAARVEASEGKVPRAVESMEKAAQLLAQANAPTDWAKKLMGDLLMDSGRLDEAEPLLKEADYDSSLGRLNLLKGQPQKAIDAYGQLLSAAQKEQNLDELFTAYTGLGKAFEALKHYDRAQQHYGKAVEIAEDIRASLLVSERGNFFSVAVGGFLRSEPAKGQVRTSLKQNQPERSIYPGEVTRARGFADNISQKADRSHFDVGRQVIEKETALADKVAALKTALAVVPKTADSRRWEELTGRIKRVEGESRAFVKSLCENHRDYCAVIHPSPVDLRRADVGPDEHILIFDVLSDGVAIRLLKGRTIVKACLVEVNPQSLENDIRTFRAPFDRVQLGKFSGELATALHKLLTAPVLESVPVGSPVVIIPDGALALLPFEALVIRGTAAWKAGTYGPYPTGLTYLADRNPIAYSQSLTAMTLVRQLAKKEKTGPAILVMADPVFKPSDERVRDIMLSRQDADHGNGSREKAAVQHALAGRGSFRRLTESLELANGLRKQYGDSCNVLTGLGCTKRQFLNCISGNSNTYGSIVFGTHGFAANDIPGLMEPFLALTMVPEGTDGFLTMSDVAGLKIHTEVAALMACKSGIGARLEGEGVMSMGRSFQCAGAKSVLMSLWSVAEKPSVMLIEEFFTGRRNGLGKLQAWTRSRATVREKGFEHPFFWASFILVGEKD
jgi:CHAT domain-containing protein/tetratricopeptide (TPR) repeat protein